ncbi:MAG: hypothetical protein ACYDDA_16220, partial [Acidiferrobacteraceae bacterium]
MRPSCVVSRWVAAVASSAPGLSSCLEGVPERCWRWFALWLSGAVTDSLAESTSGAHRCGFHSN